MARVNHDSRRGSGFLAAGHAGLEHCRSTACITVDDELCLVGFAKRRAEAAGVKVGCLRLLMRRSSRESDAGRLAWSSLRGPADRHSDICVSAL